MSCDPTTLDMKVGAALYFWRGFNGQSQREVAGRVGMSRQSYSRYADSRVTPLFGTFLRLAEALDVSPYMLALTMEAL